MGRIKEWGCFTAVVLLCLTAVGQPGNTQESYEIRRQALIESSLAHPDNEALMIQAYTGAPLDMGRLQNMANSLEGDQNPDFRIIQLLRILFLTDGEYDENILPYIAEIPLWLNEGDDLRIYTSENHMIMYLGSAYLLDQKYGWDIHPTTEEMLRAWLQLKIDYGFYEFFSSTYLPYTFAALLNLVDFCEDESIREMAVQVTNRLIHDILLITNDRGVYYPVAGRNYPGKYESAWNQNHSRLIWLVTGLGEVPVTPSLSGAFLATSEFDVSQALAEWEPIVNTIYSYGHPLSAYMDILGYLNKEDRIPFQWSAGAYFHPDVADDTMWLAEFYEIWGMMGLPDLGFLPIELGPVLALIGAAFSRSSYLSNIDVHVFKNGPVTLSSVEDYWPGRRGYQQYPFMANTGEISVYTASGPVIPFTERDDLQSNTHFPKVIQNENAALILYRPMLEFALLGIDLRVSLHMPEEKFDEVRRYAKWVLGRDGDGYVAVFRPCHGVVNGLAACPTNLVSLWAIVVGSEAMYGSFDAFEQAIRNATFREGWAYNQDLKDWDYTASLNFAGKELKGSISPAEDEAGLQQFAAEDILHAYPNPASRTTRLDLSGFSGQEVQLRAINSMGQQVWSTKGPATELEALDVSQWPAGWYLVRAEGNSLQKAMLLSVGR